MDGNEVTQKIRVAIKTKLVELGAYVDDELPDYIMVMIANKKTKDQMAHDLSLFLGSSTANFTTWLQGVLDHLQAIASAETKKVKEESIRAEEPMRPVLPPHLELATKELAGSRTKASDPEYSDEVLALKADPEPDDDDDLAGDLRVATEVPVGKMAVTNSGSVSLVHPIPRVTGPEQAAPSKVRSPKKGGLSGVVRRKPQFLSDNEDEEEEYDPSNPSVSSVASVVKVLERK